jgi:tRNA threonylcarbamoyl adenosine modification protein YeaZ
MLERSLLAAKRPVLGAAGPVTGPVLAIETVTDKLGVALASGQQLLGEVDLHVGNRHLETLHCLIAEMLDHLGLGFSDLAGFGVDLGPGRFTGTRVGVAAARAFARALGKPLVGFTSLELLAEGVARSGLAAMGASVLSVVDARRGEVFFQPFRLQQAASGGGSFLPVACAQGGLARPEQLEAMVVKGEIPGVDGSTIRPDGWLLGTPRAAVVALAAAERLAGSGSECAKPGDPWDPSNAVPVYLRAPDTRIKWETRDAATATS